MNECYKYSAPLALKDDNIDPLIFYLHTLQTISRFVIYKTAAGFQFRPHLANKIRCLLIRCRLIWLKFL